MTADVTGIEMSFRDQRVGTSHSDRVREDVSLEYVTLSQQTYIPFVMKEAMSWVGWRKFNTKKESQSSFGSGTQRKSHRVPSGVAL